MELNYIYYPKKVDKKRVRHLWNIARDIYTQIRVVNAFRRYRR